MDRCDLAAQHYKVALKYSSGTFASTVKNHIGSCAYFMKDFEEAYSWFSQSMNPYRVKEDPPHMYQYAYSTAIVGDVEKAIRILDMLLLTLDPEEESLKAKAVKFRQDLISDREIDLGIKDWLRSLVE
jgi:tetratricopeptide (TPR) repeat protein